MARHAHDAARSVPPPPGSDPFVEFVGTRLGGLVAWARSSIFTPEFHDLFTRASTPTARLQESPAPRRGERLERGWRTPGHGPPSPSPYAAPQPRARRSNFNDLKY